GGAIVQDAGDVAAEQAAKAFQFELHEDAGVVVFDAAEIQRIVVDPLPRDHAHRPAAIVVFDPGDRFQVPVVRVVVVPAGDHRPRGIYRPDARNVRLIDRAVETGRGEVRGVVAVTVAEI